MQKRIIEESGYKKIRAKFVENQVFEKFIQNQHCANLHNCGAKKTIEDSRTNLSWPARHDAARYLKIIQISLLFISLHR